MNGKPSNPEAVWMDPGERVGQMWDHLGVRRAHVAGRHPAVCAPLLAARPGLVSTLSFVGPPGFFDAGVFAAFEDRVLVVHGDHGPGVEALRTSAAALRGTRVVSLAGHRQVGWSDTIAERTEEVAEALFGFLADADARDPLPPLPDDGPADGEIAGVTYRVRGAGPPLVLFPLGLAASGWDPLLPRLAKRYRTIELGGEHIGMVAWLEQRAGSGYGDMVRGLLAAAGIGPGQSVLEVGCGSGAIARWAAERVGPRGRVVGVDINRYLLREAAALARRSSEHAGIEFREASALELPFGDGEFDLVYSVTVLEEVDADRALAELVRVTRPGGRIAAVVRAVDMPFWINVEARPELLGRATSAVFGGASSGGCADAGLYRRFVSAGLDDLRMGPQLAVVSPAWPDLCTSYEGTFVQALDPADRAEWHAAVARTRADGTFFFAAPHHCAVGARAGG